jgi:COP9 signalosome complex subunit 5
MEVMGMLFGRRDADSIVVFDVVALPVEGTETRVNAGQDAMEFQGNNLDLMNYVHFTLTILYFRLAKTCSE